MSKRIEKMSFDCNKHLLIGGTIIKIIEWERQKICDDLLDHVIDYNSSL